MTHVNRRPTALPLRILAVLFVVGTLADITTTYIALTTGPFVEGSPVGAFFIAQFGLVPGMVVTKLAGLPLLVVPVVVVREYRPTVGVLILAGATVLSFAAAMWNLAALGGV